MRVFLSKQLAAVVLAVFLSSAGSALSAAGSSAAGEDGRRPQQPVTISADRLVSDRQARTATFTGKVKVVRGDSTIEADSLTVFYAEKPPGSGEPVPVRSAVERIVAEGNVRIRSAQLSAHTPKAVYSRPDQTIELLGAGTRVVSGSHSISGSKVVLLMEGEQLIVSGSGDKRVEALLEPGTKK